MPSLNKVILIGRLTRDPELRYTAGGLAVTSFSIAVDRRFKNQQGERQTDFFRCKAWRQQAEFVANYIQKGRLVAVEGSIEMNEVTGQDGSKRTFVDIVCNSIEALEGPRDANRGEGGGYEGGGQSRAQTAPQVADDNGYYPEEDVAPRAPQARAPQPAPARSAPPAKKPEAAYPAEDDYDDSDPFADE